jgi:hypothetical protein
MRLIHPGPEEAMLCLRAVRSVVARAEGIPPASRAIDNGCNNECRAVARLIGAQR